MYQARRLFISGTVNDYLNQLIPALMIILVAGCMQQGEAPQENTKATEGEITPMRPLVDPADVNHAPAILSEPVTSTNLDQTYFYPVKVFDPDGDPVTWSLETAAAGLDIDPDSGAIYGMKLVPGSYGVLVSVKDGQGGTDEQRYTLVVTANPSITSSAPNHTFTGYTYSYEVYAASPDNTALIYTLETAPAGMNIDIDSGRVEWEAPVAGEHDIVINVTSITGLSASQEYTLNVLDADSLTIISNPETTAFESQAYVYQVSVLSLAEADKTYTLTAGEPGMSIDATTGLLKWVPETPGIFTVELSVLDVNGRSATQGFDIHVRSLEEMDQLFSGLIQSIYDSLVAGDINTARTYLAIEAQVNYIPVLEALLPFMDEIIARLGAMERVSISHASAEYIIPRTLNGETRLYIATFIPDADGNWRLYSF